MPRIAKFSPERWLHPWYKYAYCYPKRGWIYTSVDSNREATKLQWNSTNKARAMKILDERIADKQRPKKRATETNAGTISGLVRTFYLTQMRNMERTTRLQYKVAFRQFLPTDLNLDDYELIRDMILEVMNTANQTNNTLWKRVQRVRKLFQFAVDEGMMARNPITKSMVPKYEPKPVRTFTTTEIKLILSSIPQDTELGHFVRLAFRTGMRIGELINLDWDHIKPDYMVIDGKTGKRVFPFRQFPAVRRQILQLSDINIDKVFSWRHQQVPARQFRTLLLELGIEGKSFHTIRKTVINIWRERGFDFELRTLLAGHDIETQKDFYLDTPDLKYFDMKFEKIG